MQMSHRLEAWLSFYLSYYTMQYLVSVVQGVLKILNKMENFNSALVLKCPSNCATFLCLPGGASLIVYEIPIVKSHPVYQTSECCMVAA